MPMERTKSTKKGLKHQGIPMAQYSMDKYLDSPANRTRSASGKNLNKMAEPNPALSGKLPIIHEENVTNEKELLNNQTKEGFVAGIVEQLNNSPNTTPVKGITRSSNQREHDDANQSTETHPLKTSHVVADHDTTISSEIDCTNTNKQMEKTKLAEILVELNSTMKDIQKDLRQINKVQQEHTCKVSTLEFVQKDEVQEMRKVQARLNEQERTIEMLLHHVSKQDQRIQELTVKQNDSQARSMRKNLVISGIPEAKRENCTQVVTYFFQQELKLPRAVDIKVAHRIGAGSNRPMVVKLAKFDDKQFIFQHTQKLKGTEFYIAEQLPEELAECKKQQQRLKGQNKRLPSNEQLEINTKRDKIYINNERFRPSITAPNALAWLNKSEEEKSKIKRTTVTKGAIDSKTTSTFISYVAEVKCIDEVQAAYEKVFTLEPRATHIVCAYMLPGRNFPTQQNGEDDREFGAARQIL